jgi:hypothetical protein
MKFDFKPSTVLFVGGIALAGVFVLTAIFSPESLDWILHPSDERSESIKKEMERQKGNGADGRPDARPGSEEAKNGALTPTPSPEETIQPQEAERRGEERIPRPECISLNQIINSIRASKEAGEGRVIDISVNPDGRQILVTYRKKTFLGIGSGENQIEGILRRGLRNRFPDNLINSLKVRSDGFRPIRRGEQNVNVEILVIETLLVDCRDR